MVKILNFFVSGQTCGQTEELMIFRHSGEPKKSVLSRVFGSSRKFYAENGDWVPNVALYQAEPHLDNVFENDCNMCFMSFQFARAPRGRERCRRMVALFSQRSSLQHSLLWAGQSLKTVCQTVFNSFTTKLSHTSIMFLKMIVICALWVSNFPSAPRARTLPSHGRVVLSAELASTLPALGRSIAKNSLPDCF